MHLALFIDFDETITRSNVTDGVLAQFAAPSWLAIQEQWVAGKLGAREVLEKQMPLIDVLPADLDAFIDRVDIDPFFPGFVARCGEANDSLFILSDGFDYWIDRIVGRALGGDKGLVQRVRIFACALKCQGRGVAISFPYFPEGCVHGCATCKPAIFESFKSAGAKTVVIGDGVSDFLLAERADLVLAKGELREFCRARAIPHRVFRDFRDVSALVESFRGNGMSHPSL